MLRSKQLTPDQALQKARHYCAYQERCHQELRQKLYEYGLRQAEVENAIATLIDEDYLNEERFALQFAGGKFRMKSWGYNRITRELQQRQISDYCIRKAIQAISPEDYRKTLEKITRSKWEQLAGEQPLVRIKKVQDYLLYKGFDWSEIREIIARTQDQASVD
ncbi:regulatory protein RecX [Flavihumibacter petaseus]|uniref:Regulatory protein RecX n=1 Tax=Flavihumibacter petaseus NBRC 106054 TaxID=1220578 RepID=A0A0E9MXV1_9BACT|nr:regulatory protein RecX [Flavihumibacter petaseus]GAO42261.1 regulatory protein RecX [Flavihumibacter petaseus NBRC 106054]